MIRSSGGPLRIAVVFVGLVVVAVPIVLGHPTLVLAGLAIIAALAYSIRTIEHPDVYRRASHLVYGTSLAAIAYAVWGLGIATPITVYMPAAILLAAAHILGRRAALFWAVPAVAMILAGVYWPSPKEHAVSPHVTAAVRSVALLTILALGLAFREVHDRQAAALLRGAATDALTGLANRRELSRALHGALLRARRYGRTGALVFVDIDGLKAVNDRLGHAAGDELIRVVGARIASHTRQVDTAARIGGDEFVVLLDEIDDAKAAEVVAQKMLSLISMPLPIAGEDVAPTASIGVAVFPDAAGAPDAVMRLADDAMYEAKRGGGGRIYWVDGEGLRPL